MIKFSQKVSGILQQTVIDSFYLIRVGSYRFTNNSYDITLPSGETYSVDNLVQGIQPPQLSSSVDSQEYIISFVDPNLELGSLFESSIGSPVEVRIAFIDPVTKSPLLSSEDLFIVYSGIVAGTSYQVSTSEIGESIYQIACSSPMSNLDMTRSFDGNRTFIKERIDPTDTAFDYVYEGGGRVRLKWGKV